MSNSTDIFELQRRQKAHDQEYHYDIYTLSYPKRMNHYALHFSKYVGRLSRKYPNSDQRKTQIKKTIADCFIVALAAANTLDIDLSERLSNKTSVYHADGAGSSAYKPSTAEPVIDEEIQDRLFADLADPAGRISNVMESLDHMEGMDTRGILETEIVNIVTILKDSAEYSGVDLDNLLDERWQEIEDESIL